MQELTMQGMQQKKIHESCFGCDTNPWHIESNHILQPPKYLIICSVNQLLYAANNKYSTPMDMTITFGRRRFSLQATIDHYYDGNVHSFRTTDLGFLVLGNLVLQFLASQGYMFLPLDLLLEYCIVYVTIGPLNFNFVFSTRIFYRGVPGFATDCPCSTWWRGLTICLLYVVFSILSYGYRYHVTLCLCQLHPISL